ncbi:hypothetical protein BT96DRAFT_1026684 [Gymnopus androsaceus JB14]|uniref:Secreted protein n=1 Tax=Gymnopus androsaceus JB14 TaxID=1447944 RepID=A0A6A4GHV9_9AGAR|nr:hypothetical protein BT96DRAFT_1026684 [Gymnopus androsaceus JB14]
MHGVFNLKLTFILLVLSSVMSLAAAQAAVQCLSVDKVGSPLVGKGVDNGDGTVTCTYVTARACTYFAANGENDSGSSDCPAGIPQTATAAQATVQCLPVDNAGSPLVGQGVDNGDGTVTCTYVTARACTYFAANGENDSGSSDCPAGIPQTATAAAQAAVQCLSVDKAGSPLVGQGVDNGDGTVTCTYVTARACTYFAANGENDSGSSDCPAGIPQTVSGSSSSSTAIASSSISSKADAMYDDRVEAMYIESVAIDSDEDHIRTV